LADFCAVRSFSSSCQQLPGGQQGGAMTPEQLHYHLDDKRVAVTVYCESIRAFTAYCHLVDNLGTIGNCAQQNLAGLEL